MILIYKDRCDYYGGYDEIFYGTDKDFIDWLTDPKDPYCYKESFLREIK